MFVVVLIMYAFLSVGGLTLFKIGAQQTLNVGITGSALSLSISWLSLLGLVVVIYAEALILLIGMLPFIRCFM